MSYASTILADSPLAYWPMTESSGTTMTDASGNSHNGTYHGVTFGAAGPLCEGGTGVSFDGTDDYADAALDLSGTSIVSFETWALFTSFANDDHMLAEFTANYSSDSPGHGFAISPNNNGVINSATVGTYAAGERTSFATFAWREFTRPSIGAWHHIINTFNRNTSQQTHAYVDGVTAGIDANDATGGSFCNSSLYIASRAGSSLFLAVTLAQTAVYTSELSSTQALAHYKAGINCDQAYWGIGP